MLTCWETLTDKSDYTQQLAPSPVHGARGLSINKCKLVLKFAWLVETKIGATASKHWASNRILAGIGGFRLPRGQWSVLCDFALTWWPPCWPPN